MTNQITACNNVVSQYDAALRWGNLNPDETLDKFNADLEAAGINKIIEEKQRQLDEYLASKEKFSPASDRKSLPGETREGFFAFCLP